MSVVNASVELLRCKACQRELSNLAFGADTDMPTASLASLSSVAGDEVMAVHLSAGELNSDGADGLLKRISAQLDRDDSCRPVFKGAITTEAKLGETFAAFGARRQAPVPRYACPLCSGGEMTPVATLSLPEFTSQGGKLTDLTGAISDA